MTAFLGFKPNEGEYKVMGLAAYGNPNVYMDKVKKLISYENGTLKCNMKVFCWDREDSSMFNVKLCELLEIEPKDTNLPIVQIHKDLAAAVQLNYENILIKILNDLYKKYEIKNLILGGGCAYNGLANGKILKRTKYKKLWIPVAPSDAGSCVGACLNYLASKNKVYKITPNPFLGPSYLYNNVIEAIGKLKYKQFTSEEKMLKVVAKLLWEGKIIGWYHGHNEFGQRALGNRSILANPFINGVKDKINNIIKQRENFRPLAPAVIVEKQNEYFNTIGDVPYMNKIVNVKRKYKKLLKEVSNVDGTARIQSVNKNTLFHKLLLEFEILSNHPILLNTSFNTKDRPMVLTPKNAVDSYLNSDIDLLIIGNFIIYKH
jgi:carbamoyltransferase